jgi:hypothetical protein
MDTEYSIIRCHINEMIAALRKLFRSQGQASEALSTFNPL